MLALGMLAAFAPQAAAQTRVYAFIANSGTDNLHIIDTTTNAVIGPPLNMPNDTRGGAMSPDGTRYYAAALGANEIGVVDLATMTALPNIPLGVTSLGGAVTNDGRKLYVCGFQTATVKIVDLATGTVVKTLPVGNNPLAVAMSPDGTRAYVNNSASASMSIIDTATETVIDTYAVGPGGGSAVVTLDNARVYNANFGSSTVSVYDVSTDTVIATIPVPTNPGSVALSPDGHEIAVESYLAGSVSFIDIATNTVTATVPIGSRGHGVSYTPDGSRLYAIRFDADSVIPIDATTHALGTSIAVGDGPYSLDNVMSPVILTTACGGCGALSIAGDADLQALGVRRFVVFNTGLLRLTAPWTTTRSLSVLSGNGTIDTQAFDATIDGEVRSDGLLTKQGTGTLTLNGASTHALGTTVEAGTLIVNGTHTGPITMAAGLLGGTGTLAAVTVQDATLDPGVGGPGLLHADAVTLDAASVFAAQINGPAAGTGYDRLDATTSVALNGAALHVLAGYSPASGVVFTIITNATGTFAGLPEDALVDGGNGTFFHISYHGGSGNDVTLSVDAPPTITALPDQTINAGSTTGPLAFTLGDDITAPGALTLSATSSNHDLVPVADIVFGGSGADRTVTVTPVPGASGVATITVFVTDALGQSASRSFTLTVNALPVYYLAEGATGHFFSTDLLIANPNSATAPVTVTYFKDDGTTVVQMRDLAATSRTTIRVNDVAGMEWAAFSTSVTSHAGLPLVVERTMWWDPSGYGSHTEKASEAAQTQWYFAEGSQGFFHTYFLLLNPHQVATNAHVTYLLEGGEAVQRDYVVPATGRLTIDAAGEPALQDRSFGARVTFDLAGMAERAMYFGDTPLYSGGHAAAGLTTPSTTWFLAEGATGTFFDTFVLMANPNDADAHVTLTFLPASGVPVPKPHVIPGHQRLTVNIATEDPVLESAAVSTQIESDQPIIAERSQYWPHGNWYESHNSAGEVTGGTKWGLAEGRVGGANHAQTYILVANPGTIAANLTVTFLRLNGTTLVKTFVVGPTSRFNIAVTGPDSSVPELADESFGAVIESTQPVIVERSLYTDANGVTWAAGTNATATRLP
jgi:autotransporter-associated beta strand protein/YVTN family beta-propeller protein